MTRLKRVMKSGMFLQTDPLTKCVKCEKLSWREAKLRSSDFRVPHFSLKQFDRTSNRPIFLEEKTNNNIQVV